MSVFSMHIYIYIYTHTCFPSNTTTHFYCNTTIFGNVWDLTKTNDFYVVLEVKCVYLCLLICKQNVWQPPDWFCKSKTLTLLTANRTMFLLIHMCFLDHLSVFIHVLKCHDFERLTKWTHVDTIFWRGAQSRHWFWSYGTDSQDIQYIKHKL